MLTTVAPREAGRDVFFKAALVGWIIISTVLGRSFTALVRTPFDSQLYAYVGSEWMHGRVPYLEVWENKPPGIYAINAIVFYFWPQSFRAIAAVEALFILGTILTIFLILRANFKAPLQIALIGAAAASITLNLQAFNESGNLTEVYLLLPAALSVFVFTRPLARERLWIVGLAGFLSGLAALIKPVGLAPLLAESAAIFLFVVFDRLSLRRAMLCGLALLCGAALAWMPAVIYFAPHGAAGELLNASLLYNIHYGAASQGHRRTLLLVVASRLQPISTVVVCAAVGLALLSFARDKNTPETPLPSLMSCAVVFLWVLFDVMGALAGGRNLPHYFLPAVGSLSAAAGLGYWICVERLQGPKVIASLVFCPLLLSQATDLLALRNSLIKEDLRGWERMTDRLKLVADRINAEKRPGDTLFTWQFFIQVYFDTGLRCPSRFVSGAYIFDSPATESRVGPELLGALETAPPIFVLDATLDPDSVPQSPFYTRLRRLLKSRYDLDFEIPNPTRDDGLGDLKVFRLREPVR